MFFCFVTKHACDGRTDTLTDGQNYDTQDRASIAASRGKNRILLYKILEYGAGSGESNLLDQLPKGITLRQ